jgi:hypothetical protein
VVPPSNQRDARAVGQIPLTRPSLFLGVYRSSWIRIQVERSCVSNTLTRTPPFIIHRHDLLGWTVTAIISPIRDRICLQLAPAPSTMNGGPAAGAEQCVFFQRSGNKGHQKGAVSVGTEANQISSATLRTFHAVANTEAHRTRLQSYIRLVKELLRKCRRHV